MIVLLCAFVAAVFAVSSGKVSSCDADIDLYGCKPGGWPIDPLTNNSIRSNCTDKTRIMTWVTSPVLADKTFKIFAGSNEDATLTEYIPGQRMLINLRVLVYGMQYRGLLMYAIDAKKSKVGDWDPIDRVPMVHGFCAKSVVHSGAELKPYLMTFGFTAPVAGTGNISFSSLIKTGVANTGEFWYANRLVLTEKVGATAAPQQWYRATTAGQSCDEVCSACGGTCTAGDLMKIDSPAAIDSMISPYAFCAKPYLLRCGAEGATSGSTDGVCFFRNDTACTELGLPKTATTCAFKPVATVDQTAYRLCPCAGATKCSGPVATTNPGGFTTVGVTKTTVTIPPATTRPPTAAPTTQPPVVTTAPPPGVTTPRPTQPPVTTTPATTQATCAAGTLGCKCDASNQCAGGNLCSNSVCIVRSPCLYGELGCACTPGTNDCNSAKYTCSPTSLKCVEKERTLCDEKNGQLGCWCRENGLCDAGLRCDDTRNCVKDAEYTCGAGEAGCKCKEDGTCNNDLRCATFSTESVCVTKDPVLTDPTDGMTLGGSGSGAASIVVATCALVVALLAQF